MFFDKIKNFVILSEAKNLLTQQIARVVLHRNNSIDSRLLNIRFGYFSSQEFLRYAQNDNSDF